LIFQTVHVSGKDLLRCLQEIKSLESTIDLMTQRLRRLEVEHKALREEMNAWLSDDHYVVADQDDV